MRSRCVLFARTFPRIFPDRPRTNPGEFLSDLVRTGHLVPNRRGQETPRDFHERRSGREEVRFSHRGAIDSRKWTSAKYVSRCASCLSLAPEITGVVAHARMYQPGSYVIPRPSRLSHTKVACVRSPARFRDDNFVCRTLKRGKEIYRRIIVAPLPQPPSLVGRLRPNGFLSITTVNIAQLASTNIRGNGPAIFLRLSDSRQDVCACSRCTFLTSFPPSCYRMHIRRIHESLLYPGIR